MKDFDNLPGEVKDLKEAIEANADKATLGLRNPVSVERQPNGDWVVCDNYESFWSTMYLFRGGKWFVRSMFSGEPEKEYSFELAMADASMMYTG